MSNNESFGSGEFEFLTDVRNLETPNQRILREVFDVTEAINRAKLAEFDPLMPDAGTDIELATNFPEAETAEPQLAASKRQNMLSALGLSFSYLEPGHPERIFEYTYFGGEAEQIRLITRADGTQVPVFTALGSNQEGNTVDRIRLLSHERAEALATRLENNLDEQKVDIRLAEDFGLDQTMLALVDLSYEDKRSMLAAYDEIQNLEVIKPDTAVLDRVRRRLVKAMLPGTKFLSFARSRKLKETQDAYGKSVLGLAEHYGLDAKTTKEFVLSEQLCRLKALNEQLRFRKRATKLGFIAMYGGMTVFGIGTGAAAGRIVGVASGAITQPEMNDGTVKAAAIGALVGGGSGLLIGIEQGKLMRNRARHISGFSAARFESYDSLGRQLQEEQSLAKAYIGLLSH